MLVKKFNANTGSFSILRHKRGVFQTLTFYNVLSLFVLCYFFLRGREKKERTITLALHRGYKGVSLRSIHEKKNIIINIIKKYMNKKALK